MSRRTDPVKQAKKVADRKEARATIAQTKVDQQAAFEAMFADVIENTPIEQIEEIAALSEEDITRVEGSGATSAR